MGYSGPLLLLFPEALDALGPFLFLLVSLFSESENKKSI